MARTVKPTLKQWIPGAGRTATGVPTQGKTRTVGRITVTSYTKGGESLTPADVGLSNIDFITIKDREQTGSPEARSTRGVLYSNVAQQFYLVTTGVAGDVAERAGAAATELEFVAEGDSAHDVELL